MIDSELLKEKHRTQTKLSGECASVHDYLARSHAAAEEIAISYGFHLQYAEMPNDSRQWTALRAASDAGCVCAGHGTKLERCKPSCQVIAESSEDIVVMVTGKII